MYGFFPPEEAVPALFAPSVEIALTFFRRAEEEVAPTLFTAAEEGAAPTFFAPVEGDVSSFFALVGGVGKKKFQRCTNHGAIATKRCALRPRVKSSPTKQGMLGVDGVGDRRCWAILVRNLSAENWKIQEERKRSIQERREMASEQPSSTAENRVHPTCTERQSLNKECGWKGGDRSGLAQGQELTGRKRRTKTSLQERKTYLTLTGLLMEGLQRRRARPPSAGWCRCACGRRRPRQFQSSVRAALARRATALQYLLPDGPVSLHRPPRNRPRDR